MNQHHPTQADKQKNTLTIMPDGKLDTEVVTLGVGLEGRAPAVSVLAESIAANPPKPRKLARLWGPVASPTPPER